MKIIHLIPFDAIGGVEVAAKSFNTGTYDGFSFGRYYLVGERSNTEDLSCEDCGPNLGVNSPRAYWAGIKFLLKSNPDVVIASLWRSVALALVFKILRPRTQLIVFLHLSKDAHLLDRLFTYFGIWASTYIWADSERTLFSRVPGRYLAKARIISFLLDRKTMPKRRQPSADFIFWGRLHKQKDIPRALKLFSGVCKSCPDSRLLIIGPDGGELNEVIAVTERLKIKNNLCLRSGMKREDIFAEAQRASFFLQTSKEEGMSMAVVEAMQLGLVPVVTNVGEISNYCRHGDNSIIVQKEQDTDSIDSILRLLNDPAKFSQMSYAAAEEWQSKATYREDVLSACQDIVERGAS